MDKEQLINDVEKQLDEHYLYASYINEAGSNKGMLKDLIEKKLVYMNGVTATNLTSYIKNKIYPKLKVLTDEELKNTKFLLECIRQIEEKKGVYIDTIINEEDQIQSFKEFLMSNIKKNNINSNFELEIIIPVNGTSETRVRSCPITTLYDRFHSGNRLKKEELLKDKIETIKHYLDVLVEDEELRKSIYKDGKTFEQFMFEILPTIMTPGGTVSFIDESGVQVDMNVDKFIVEEAKSLEKRIEYEKELFYNKVNENPADMPEITEYSNLPDFNKENEYEFSYTQLNLLKERIYNAISIDEFMEIIDEYEDFISKINKNVLIEYKDLIDSINNIISEKERKLRSININKDDYINSILERLVTISNEISMIKERKDMIDIIYKIDQIKHELLDKNIHSKTIESKIEELEDRIEDIRYNTNTSEELRKINEKIATDGYDVSFSELNIDENEALVTTGTLQASKEVSMNKHESDIIGRINRDLSAGTIPIDKANQLLDRLNGSTEVTNGRRV